MAVGPPRRVAALRRARGVRQVVSDYVALTKPKVQSLLLLTTVTTMYVAGDPSLGLVLVTLRRRLPVGRRRRRGQPLLRPRHRRADGAHGRPAGAGGARLARGGADLRHRARRAVVRCSCRSCVNLARRRAVALAASSATSLVYTVWLKRRTPQNIVIGGAAGAVPPLVGWAAVDRRAHRHGDLPLRDRLLLDAAALLGAVAAHEGRVRARRRADAAGRPRRGRDAPPDPALHGAALRGDAAAVLRRRLRRRSTSSRSLVLGALFIAGARRAATAAPTGARALRLYLFSLAYLALLFAAMVADAKL